MGNKPVQPGKFNQYGLSQQEILQLQNYFKGLAGKDNKLDFTEFIRLYAQLDPQANGPYIQQIAGRAFSTADANRDGFISFDEFIGFYVMSRSQPQNISNNMHNYLNDCTGNTGYLTPNQAYQYANYAHNYFGRPVNAPPPQQMIQTFQQQYGNQIPIGAFVNELTPIYMF